jgi:hypothetical protein
MLAAATGCGKKGPPQAPLVIAPAPVTDVSASRMGDRAIVRFTMPEKNTDNSTPADLSRVDMYALSVADAAGAPDAGVIVREGARVASLVVNKATAAAEQEPPAGRRTLSETLTAEAETFWQPMRPAGRRGSANSAASVAPPASTASTAGEAKAEETKPLPVRVYALVPVSSRGRKGPAGLATVALGPAPAAPPAPVVTFTERAIVVTWVAVKQSAGYNVYEAGHAGSSGSTGSPPAALSPLNDGLLKDATFEDKRVEFGKERCYSVTGVELVQQRRIESVLSAPACVTPVDTFPPAAPTGLAAVAGPGTMSLIWDAVTAGDLAGYVVLRGVAGGDTLQALTPEPIKETTFKDATVTPGTRYVYAVIAVDTAKNKSAEARVEETAR